MNSRFVITLSDMDMSLDEALRLSPHQDDKFAEVPPFSFSHPRPKFLQYCVKLLRGFKAAWRELKRHIIADSSRSRNPSDLH